MSIDRRSDEAIERDLADPLAGFRSRFHLPTGASGEPLVYLCGHSLGLMPIDAVRDVNSVLRDWATLGVQGHFAGEHPWLTYHEAFAAPLARLLGAQPSEVVAMNTLTVNLHLLLAGFYTPSKSRYRILIEKDAFPSDRYAVRSILARHGHDSPEALIEVAPDQSTGHWHTGAVIAAIEAAGGSLALVLLPGVQYLNGQALDIPTITAAAHRVGAAVGFDLAHAVGNVPLSLHDDGPDFAVWCHYKYLCAGPGAVGGAFIHDRHADRPPPHLAGWWGHELSSRFAMPQVFQESRGADGWQLSNPPILSLAPLRAALEVYESAGFERIRKKSLALTQFARRLIAERCGAHVSIITPDDPSAHGSQLSLRVHGGSSPGRRVHERLHRAGIITDWREPDVMRLAPIPLYTRFADVDVAIATLSQALTP